MADYPPFMNAYGSIPKILEKIKEAKTPDRFTQDFLSTVIGFSGGSSKAFIPFAKRIGLLASDGTPTNIYRRFRDAAESKSAMAEAMRKGYATIFQKNEYANKLPKEKLEGLVIQATGLEKGAPTVRSICGSFDALRAYADFDGLVSAPAGTPNGNGEIETVSSQDEPIAQASKLKMNLSYTINLNLPKSDDIAVFNAIFRSLKENLLK